MRLKRYDEALAVSRRAFELDPDHKEAAFNYGTCELYAGEPVSALELLRPVAVRNPDYPLLQALMAVLCFACDHPDEGREKVDMLKACGYGIDSYICERISVLESLGKDGVSDAVKRSGVGQSLQRG